MVKCQKTRWLVGALLLLSLPLASAPPSLSIPRARAGGTTYYIGTTTDDLTMSGKNGCDAPDNATCSLHGALALATSGADTVTFGSAIPNTPTTITLAQAINIGRDSPLNVTLDGTGKQVTLKGNGASVLKVYAASTVTVNALTFTDGTTGMSAGGDIANDGTLTLNGTTVRNGTGLDGGGIENTGTLTLTNGSVVSGNTASGDTANGHGNGGGIHNAGSATLTITASTVSGNTANGSSGGGIFNDEGSVQITNSTVSGNTVGASSDASSVGGGGIYSGTTGNAMLTMTNGTVSGNIASNSYDGGGGGIRIAHGTATITASTVSGNTLTSDTNGRTGYAGGLYSSGTVTMKNTLVAGNTTSGNALNADFYEMIGTHTFAYNLIGDGTGIPGSGGGDAYGDLIGVAPRFAGDPAMPQNYGGPTTTVALSADSPAIDAIPTANCLVKIDGRGVTRPQPTSGKCDIGAFEARNTLTATTGSPQNVVARHTAAPLVVSLVSGDGVPVAGITITFTAPASGASGTFAGGVTAATATIADDGTAIAPTFTTNGIPGAITLAATAGNLHCSFALTNTAPAITLTAVSLPPATGGVAYHPAPFGAMGGTAPYAFAVPSGLPPGLTLGANDGTHNGQLTGTPRGAGSFPFTVTATDADGFTGSQNYTVTITLGIATVAPASGDVQGGESITITGVGFVAGGTTVTIGGNIATVRSVSPTQIVIVAPPGSAGAADIAITVNARTTLQAAAYTYGSVGAVPTAHATSPTIAVAPKPVPATRPAGPRGNAGTPTPNPAPDRHPS